MTGSSAGGTDAGSAAILAGSKMACGLVLADRFDTIAGGRLSAAMFSWIFFGRSCERIAPKIATPMVPPMLRQNWIWLETTPRYWRGTAACEALIYSGNVAPRPRPTRP